VIGVGQAGFVQLLQVKRQIVNTLCVQELLDNIRGLKSTNSLDILIDGNIVVSFTIKRNGMVTNEKIKLSVKLTCTNDLRIF
jgi:hypothetical protein